MRDSIQRTIKCYDKSSDSSSAGVTVSLKLGEGNRTGRVKRMTGCESAEARGEKTKRERRREEKKKKQKKRLEILARTKEREKDGRGGGGGMEENYTENISLLEKFSTPLSASIVIYARDEGGYITGFRLRR